MYKTLDKKRITCYSSFVIKRKGDLPKLVCTAKKAKKILPFISKISTLKPNINEAEELSNIKIKNKKDLNRVSSWFHEKGSPASFSTRSS